MRRKRNLGLGVLAGSTLLTLLAISGSSGEEGGADKGKLDGKAIFLAQDCNVCHAVPSAGIEAKIKSEKMKAADIIDMTDWDSDELAKYLRKEAQLEDKDHRTAFKGSEEELKALVAWVREQRREQVPSQ